MKLQRTDLPDVVVIEPTVHADERGWFMETYNQQRLAQAFRDAGLPEPPPFVQDNHSCSARGVLRGLHYQLPPHAQGKLLRVVRGSAWDVAVDLRRSSPTFGRWVGIELSAANRHQLWIPVGFAHGFLALEEHTELLYKTTDVYAPPCERSLRWDDADLRIAWPLRLAHVEAPKLAPKDAAASSLGTVKAFE